MVIHEEPKGGEGGRAVADRVPISSLFGAEVISSVGNNITTLAVPWFVLVSTGSAVRTGLTGAAMGTGRSWRRCWAGRWWTGWGVLVEPLLDLRRACPGWSC
jgi:hypothetical protein